MGVFYAYGKLNSMPINNVMVELITFRAYDGKEYKIKAGLGAIPPNIKPILKHYAEIYNNDDLLRKHYFIEQLKEGWLKDTEVLNIESVPQRK
ncbi:hypothetical protein [Pseudomonas aeruginosa]|uniref:hypothetical protein n=1 Tax=Pseudomonas aeruginosa TaxID=287 RepID=UPI0031B67597